MIATLAQAKQERPQPVPETYLSFSRIRCYQGCPQKYAFRYLMGLPEESVSASLVFGSGIHGAIEEHFRELLAGNPPPSMEQLLAAYDREWAARDQEIRLGKDDDPGKLRDTAARVLTAFQAHALASPEGRILAVEEPLSGELLPGLPPLVGRVDLIVETPSELVVTDWKTSRSRWSAEQVEDASEQLLLYADLARDFAPGKPIRTEVAVLTKTKEVAVDRHSRPFDALKLDRTKRIIERVQKAIDAEVFYPAPSPLSCGSCPFRDPCVSVLHGHRRFAQCRAISGCRFARDRFVTCNFHNGDPGDDA